MEALHSDLVEDVASHFISADWLPPDSCPSRSWPRPRLGRVGIADTRNDLEGSPSCRDAAAKSDSIAMCFLPSSASFRELSPMLLDWSSPHAAACRAMSQ